jgi:hypothetical protein
VSSIVIASFAQKSLCWKFFAPREWQPSAGNELIAEVIQNKGLLSIDVRITFELGASGLSQPNAPGCEDHANLEQRARSHGTKIEVAPYHHGVHLY